MPELQEVETIRRQLASELTGKTVRSVLVRTKKMVRGSVPALVRTRMNRDTAAPGGDCGLSGEDDSGLLTAARVTQHRDLVDVDAEDGHTASLERRTK